MSDTGTGIPREIFSDQVLEPFTTKEVGRGSGLGLSTVYGFARQSGGHLRIYSEVGHGTTVRIYLPGARDAAVATRPAEEIKPLPVGNQTVLLVEDDDAVQAMAQRTLEELGYQVLTASDAHGALQLIKARGTSIDLMFTDIVMPGGFNGFQLAEEAKRLNPHLRLLFATGYAEEAARRAYKNEDGAQILSKPYRRRDLSEAVAAALAGRGPPEPASTRAEVLPPEPPSRLAEPSSAEPAGDGIDAASSPCGARMTNKSLEVLLFTSLRRWVLRNTRCSASWKT